MRHYPHLDLASVPLTAETLTQSDCVVLVTDHRAFDYAWIAAHAPLIVDTRNAFRGIAGGHIHPA
jgi:UDP-N-acetyl-D-glucosamine dehydrogenase